MQHYHSSNTSSLTYRFSATGQEMVGILTIKKLSWTVTTFCPPEPQNRDYNRSLIQVYNVAPLLHCACCSTHPISLLGRWRRRLSLVCNNQKHVTTLKMLDGYRTWELLWRFDGWKLLSRFRFTFLKDGGHGDKNIKGCDRIETSIIVHILCAEQS